MKKKPTGDEDPEIVAISDVYAALKDLQPDAQSRVLAYVAGKLRVLPAVSRAHHQEELGTAEVVDAVAPEPTAGAERQDGTDLEGVSPVAQKWMARNGLKVERLEAVFSLGVNEIDLIAATVPGKNKKERMRSVFLLKGVAAYLGSGVARFSHEQMKEACLHYDAFDAANFAAILKGLSSEVSGGKAEGYTLTPRGLASATEMVKGMTRG